MKWIAAVALAAMLAGCASAQSGNDFNEDNLARLRPGVTTLADASRILGAKPIQTVTYDNGKTGAIWQYVNSTAFLSDIKTDTKQAALLFDARGKFIRVVQTTTSP